MNMKLKLCFVYLVCWLLPLQCGRSRLRETTWCWKSRVVPTVASLYPILSWKLTGEVKLVIGNFTVVKVLPSLGLLLNSKTIIPSQPKTDLTTSMCLWLQAPKYKFILFTVQNGERRWEHMDGHTGLQENLCQEGFGGWAQALDHRWVVHPHQVAKSNFITTHWNTFLGQADM